MVAIVRGPSERKFRQIASADHDAPVLVCHIHKDLRALSRLRVLVSGICQCRIMSDVFEVLGNSLSDRNFHRCYTESVHQILSIRTSPGRSTETWHGDTYDTLPVPAEFIESKNCDDERQRAVQTTGNTYNRCLAVNV